MTLHVGDGMIGTKLHCFYPVLICIFFPSYFYWFNCHHCIISLVIPEVVLMVKHGIESLFVSNSFTIEAVSALRSCFLI